MSGKKKGVKAKSLGFDPLAWMDDDDGQTLAPDVSPKTIEKKKMLAKAKGKKVTPYQSTLGLNVEVLENSFSLLAPVAEEMIGQFYTNLFERFPSVIPLFAGTTQQKQVKKLMGALTLTVEHLRQPEKLVPVLKSMGERNQWAKGTKLMVQSLRTIKR